MLAFSRQQPLPPQHTDANQLLSGMEDVLRRTIPECIRMLFEVSIRSSRPRKRDRQFAG
jgi:hypothetical protein